MGEGFTSQRRAQHSQYNPSWSGCGDDFKSKFKSQLSNQSVWDRLEYLPCACAQLGMDGRREGAAFPCGGGQGGNVMATAPEPPTSSPQI